MLTLNKLGDIPVYSYTTKKFSKVLIRLVLENTFTRDNVTKYILLTTILTNTTKKYDTKEKLIEALKELYHANIYITTSGVYKRRLTYITLYCIDNKYIKEDIINKSIDLLKEFLLNPRIINNRFDDLVVDEAKLLVKNEILKEKNNVMKYATTRFYDNMFENEVFSIHNGGYLEDIDKITNEDLINTYYELLNQSRKSIFIVGDIENSNLNYLKSSLISNLNNSINNEEIICKEKINIESVKVIKEKNDNLQGNLRIGFRTSISFNNPLYYALYLFNLMLGGISSSRLNQAVREEKGLAYSIYSNILIEEQSLVISAGIDKENYDIVIKTINDEIDKFKKGDFSLDLLNISKNIMKDETLVLSDSPQRIMNNILCGILYDCPINEEEIANLFDNVTKDDIIKVSNMLKLDTIYFLSR